MKKLYFVLGIGVLLLGGLIFADLAILKLSGDFGPGGGYLEPAVQCMNANWQNMAGGCYSVEGGTKQKKVGGHCVDIESYINLKSYNCGVISGVVDLRSILSGHGKVKLYVDENAFSGTHFGEVIMPSTVTELAEGAFCNVNNDINDQGEPVCGNGIIEEGEECDGNTSSYVCSDTCQIEGTVVSTLPYTPHPGGSFIDNLIDDPESQIPLVEVGYMGIPTDEFIDSLAPACAKLKDHIEYTVTFKSEDGKNLGEIETINDYVNPENMPQMVGKKGYTGAWYLGNELFDENSQISGDISLVYKYTKLGGIEYDKENGWIRVFWEDQEIIVKDRDQGAEKSYRELFPEWYFDFEKYDDSLRDLYNNGDITEEQMDSLLLNWVNENVGLFTGLDEFFDYLYEIEDDSMSDSNIISTAGNYYFWGNNVGVSARSAIFDEENQRIDESMFDNIDFPEGFNHGYIGLEGGNDWTVGSSDTPCDASKGEYLPSPDDWKLVTQMRGKINGENIVEEGDLYTFENGSAIRDVSLDFGIFGFPAVYVDEQGASIDFLGGGLNQGSLDNGKIGYLTYRGIYVLDTSNLEGTENNLAMPVRCFVKPIKKDEEKSETHVSGMSGGGGRGSNSNVSVVDEKSHNSADEKVNSQSDEIKNEKIDLQSNEIKSEDVNNNQDKTSEILHEEVKYVPNKKLSEMEQAYDFSRSYGITTKTSVENADMNGFLTRIQMAKILSKYAMNVMGKQPDISRGTKIFDDVTYKLDKSYDNGVTLAYELGIMGINMPNNKFRPYDEVTRAEFVTALSRLLYGTQDGKGKIKYYEPHMMKLYNEGIVNKADPSIKEKRGYVMIMLMRSVK